MASPGVEFHEGGDAIERTARLIADLARTASPCLILASDLAQAQTLDARLWQLGDDIFLPHSLTHDPDAAVARVLIAAPGQAEPSKPVVLNLREQAVDLECERILELIPPDEAGRAAARSRWRVYQSRGLKPVRV